MDMGRLLAIAIGAILINNFVLARFLGLCSFIAISQRLETAVGMGLSVIFVTTMASLIIWPIYHLVLVPLQIEFLYIVTFILVIAGFVQLTEMVVRKINIVLYRSLGIYLPLITCNCMVLAVAFLNVKKIYSLGESVLHGIAAGMGYTLALILMTAIRERLELADSPPSLAGNPLAFIVAGLLSLAFVGFSGLAVE